MNLANGAQLATFFLPISISTMKKRRPASRFAKVFHGICFITNDLPKFLPAEFLPRMVFLLPMQ